MVLAVGYAAVLVLAVPANVSVATITVPDDFPAIQQAVNAASPGDKVFVRAGMYSEHVTIGKPLTLEGEDRETTIIDGAGTGKVVTVTSASNVTVSGFTTRNGGTSTSFPEDSGIVLDNASHCLISDCIMTSNGISGLHLYRSSSNTIRNCELSYNETTPIPGPVQGAIHLRYSTYNTIADNNIYSNGSDGITVRSGSSYTTIRGNHIYSNGDYGIHLGWSYHCTIVDNIVHDNRSVGLEFDAASYNTARDNVTYSNSAGIRIVFYARGNTFVGNVIRGNRFGIQIGAYNLNTYPHTFYHNDIIDNTEQVRFGTHIISHIWDDGYPNGGNYWSDYAGVDDFKGPGQNMPGSDGIGDTAYVINYRNSDRYPLMRPFHGIDVGIDIKPGSNPNSLNMDGHGVIPVAILGSADFDVTEIDLSSLSFAGLEVRVRGQGQPQCSVEDVSGDFSGGPEGAPDGHPDLVCHFIDDPGNWAPGDGEATITGNLTDGTPFAGSDEITVLPPQ
ncbi:MAG: right-handed parallel beta-helix repeat-containing protein [Planctomycetota bacterium]